MKKNSIALYLSIITLIAVVINGFLVFIGDGENEVPTLVTFGYQVVAAASPVMIYSIAKKKTKVFWASVIWIIGGFGYNFYVIYKNGFNPVYFRSGLYLFIICAVLAVITIISYLMESNNNDTNDKKEEVVNNIQNKGDYLLCNYIYGIKDRPDLFKKITAIVDNKENNAMEILIGSDEVEKVFINKSNVLDITISRSSIVSEKKEEIKSDDVANKALLLALAPTVISPLIMSADLSGDIDNYNKIDMTQIYEVEISYFDNGLTQKIMVNTKEDPQTFFRNITEKVNLK